MLKIDVFACFRFALSLGNDLTVRAKTSEVNVGDFSAGSYATILGAEVNIVIFCFSSLTTLCADTYSNLYCLVTTCTIADDTKGEAGSPSFLQNNSVLSVFRK